MDYVTSSKAADVSQRDNSPHNKAADYAVRLRKCLLSVKTELTKISPNNVRPNLDRLMTTLESALSLATSLVQKSMKPEFSLLLKRALQRMCTIATMLHVHNTKRDRAAYHPLNKSRRLLTLGRRLATLLHGELETSLELDSADDDESENDEKKVEDDTQSDSSKPSTSLSPAVQSESTVTQSGLLTSQSITPQSSLQSSTNHLSTAGTSPSCNPSTQETNDENKQTEMDTNKTTSGHWKPSFKCKFFLKPPTLVFNGLTVENVLNLGRVLSAERESITTETTTDKPDKEVQSNPQIYENTCRDLQNALESVTCESSGTNHLTTKAEMDVSTTSNTSSHWKPSLKTKFFLKPAKLAFKGMTVKLALNLGKALAIDRQSTTSNTNDKKAKQDKPSPLNYETISRDLQNALPSLAPQTTGEVNNAESTPSHWKPSLKVPFFLKPATFIFKELTAENMQNLTKLLAVEKKSVTEDCDSTSKTPSDHLTNYVTTCRDLHNALPSTSDETSQLPAEMITLPNISEEKNQELAQLATNLKQCVSRVQCEVNKLSPKDVRPSLDQFKTALNNSLSFVATVLHNHMTAEFTAALKEDLQDLSSHAKKLCVPNSKQDQSSACGLRRARHMLDTAVRKATLLHAKVEELLPPKEVVSASSEEAQSTSSSSEGTNKEIQCDTQSPPTDNIESDNAQESDHWRPSLNKPFFLKKPTLVYRKLTAENLQNLANILSSPKERSCQEVDKTSSQNQACVDTNTINQSQSTSQGETDECKEDYSKERGSTRKRKLSTLSSTLKDPILDDVIDVGVVKRRHVSTEDKSSLSTSKTLKSTKMSCNFKPPKSRSSRLVQMKHSPSKRAHEIVAHMTARELAKLDIGCKPHSKSEDARKFTAHITPTGSPCSEKTGSQSAGDTEKKQKGTYSPKANKTSSGRIILTATRRLSPCASPQEAYNKPDFIIETGLLIGAEVCVEPTQMEDDDNQDTQPHEDVNVSRATLGKRSCAKCELPTTLKQSRLF